MNSFVERLRNLVPSQSDAPEDRFFKILVYALVGIALLTLIAGISTFFVSLQGAEQTMVPNVQSYDLSQAVIALQDKQLNARVQLRNFSDPKMKGKVMSQDPAPGSVVRAGREIRLVVSSGAVVDKVDDFVGKTLGDTRVQLQTMFSTSAEPLLTIGDVSYVFDKSDPGTILQQDPKPGAALNGPTPLNLVVSRGPDVKRIAMPSMVGTGWREAMSSMATQNIPFVFNVKDAAGDEKSGVIVSQDPKAGTEVPIGTRLSVTMTRPKDIPKGKVFGVLHRTLPDYAVPVEITLEAISPQGEHNTILTMMHPGGELSFPYLEDENTTLVLYTYKSEILRVQVTAPQKPSN